MAITLYELVGADDEKPFSPHCWKVRMSLHHKKLEYRTELVRFTEISGIENGLSRTLPILRDGETLVVDSFAIADHLESRYPDRPSLYGNAAGRNYAKFLASWAQHELHPAITQIAILEILDFLDLPNREYWRRSREARFKRTLEVVSTKRDGLAPRLRQSFEPMRSVLQGTSFLTGNEPFFADYIVFGTLQWFRVVSAYSLLAKDDPVSLWFDRCLDLYDCIGRSVPAREG